MSATTHQAPPGLVDVAEQLLDPRAAGALRTRPRRSRSADTWASHASPGFAPTMGCRCLCLICAGGRHCGAFAAGGATRRSRLGCLRHSAASSGSTGHWSGRCDHMGRAADSHSDPATVVRVEHVRALCAGSRGRTVLVLAEHGPVVVTPDHAFQGVLSGAFRAVLCTQGDLLDSGLRVGAGGELTGPTVDVCTRVAAYLNSLLTRAP